MAVLRERGAILPARDLARVVNEVSDDVVGFGPIEFLLKDPSVTEVMVNGPDDVFVEREGRIERVPDRLFEGEEPVLHLIERIVGPLGLRVDQASPWVDARLPDGSRVHAIVPPLSLRGPVLTIRRFSQVAIEARDLLSTGSVGPRALRFLAACVRGRANIVISGGAGSGKTTLLGVLSGFIPDEERLITIEDAAELRLAKPHVVSLEARPANVEGRGEITVRHLVRNALRMRPDRIIVGEVRGGEALDMLQAMNTGHEGSLSTARANFVNRTPRRSAGYLGRAGRLRLRPSVEREGRSERVPDRLFEGEEPVLHRGDRLIGDADGDGPDEEVAADDRCGGRPHCTTQALAVSARGPVLAGLRVPVRPPTPPRYSRHVRPLFRRAPAARGGGGEGGHPLARHMDPGSGARDERGRTAVAGRSGLRRARSPRPNDRDPVR